MISIYIAEPKKRKPKIKIINISEEEMNLKDENLIHTILKQNELEKRRILHKSSEKDC